VLSKLSGRVPEEFHERLRNWLEDAGIQTLLVPSSPLVAEDEVAGRSGHAAWRERSS
jgi:hypothetical protein